MHDTHPLFLHPQPNINQPAPSIIAFLVQRRQSNKCGSARNVETFYLHLGCVVGPNLLIPSAKKINQEKGKNPEMRPNSQQIVLHCLHLYTHNPEVREVDLKPIPRRSSVKIHMLKEGRNTQTSQT